MKDSVIVDRAILSIHDDLSLLHHDMSIILIVT